MKKTKITLHTPEMISEFIKICSGYDCDINIYENKNILDAKSLLGVFAIAQWKPLEVQIISSEKSVISSFVEDMRKFEVKK